jgi:hypothetical protein
MGRVIPESASISEARVLTGYLSRIEHGWRLLVTNATPVCLEISDSDVLGAERMEESGFLPAKTVLWVKRGVTPREISLSSAQSQAEFLSGALLSRFLEDEQASRGDLAAAAIHLTGTLCLEVVERASDLNYVPTTEHRHMPPDDRPRHS